MRDSTGQPKGKATFKHAPIGAGGQIIKFAQSTDGATIVGAADVHGAYVKGASDKIFRQLFLSTSIPAGLQHADHTWDGTYNDHSGCGDVVVAPSLGSTIFMIYDGYLLKSTDTGATFANTGMTRFPFFCNGFGSKAWGHAITIDPNNPSVILFGTQGGHSVWYSTNGGTSFTDLVVTAPGTVGGDPAAATHLTACDPTSTQVSSIRQRWFYTRYGTGVYTSSTGPGGTYSLMNTTGMPTNPSSLWCDAFGTLWVTQFGVLNNVWKWTSGGGWVNVSISAGDQFFQITIDPTNSSRMVAAGGGRYFMSTNGGSTWPNRWSDDFTVLDQIHREASIRYLDTGPAKHFHPVANQLYFDPVTSGRLWAAWGSGVSHCDVPASSASPLIWTGIGEGIEELVAHTFCAVPGGGRFVGCWDMGAFQINDLTRPVNPQKIALAAGDTWGQTEPPVLQQPCSCIDYAADNPNWMVFMQQGGWFSTPITDPHFGYSTDGGGTLQRFPTTPPHRPFSNGGVMGAVGNAGNVIVIWNVNGMPTYTKDGGTTWADLPLSGIPADGTENGFEFQGNAGYFLNKFVITYDKAGGFFYLFNYGPPTAPSLKGLWKSTNGDSWTQVNTTGITKAAGSFTSNYVYSMHLRSVLGQAGHLFYTAGQGLSDSLMRSTDGGVTWSECTTNGGQVINFVTDVGTGKAAPGKSYPAIYFWGQVNGAYGLYRSDDSLVTTVLLSTAPAGTLDYPQVVAGDPDVYGRVWLCMSGNGVIVGDYNFTETLAA